MDTAHMDAAYIRISNLSYDARTNFDTIVSRHPCSPFTNLPAFKHKRVVAYLVTTVNLYSSSSLLSFSRVL